MKAKKKAENKGAKPRRSRKQVAIDAAAESEPQPTIAPGTGNNTARQFNRAVQTSDQKRAAEPGEPAPEEAKGHLSLEKRIERIEQFMRRHGMHIPE